MKAQPVLTRLALLCAMLLAARSLPAADAASANAGSAKPFLGEWALTTPGGKAGWLGVTEKDGKLAASVMWEAGSVEPWANAKVEGDTLIVSRPLQQGGRRGGNAANANPPTETINAKADGDTLQCTISRTRGGANAGEARKESFTGKRQPPMPPAPDLSKVKFGEPISLFNGKDLTGWRLVEKDAVNGWVVKDGALMSNPVQEPGQPHKNYGNLRTDREFEDFNLKLEANVAPNGNSGIYLRAKRLRNRRVANVSTGNETTA